MKQAQELLAMARAAVDRRARMLGNVSANAAAIPGDISTMLRRSPLALLGVAIAVGFVLGFALRRRAS